MAGLELVLELEEPTVVEISEDDVTNNPACE
jgi:hypothetical protein